MGKEASRRNPVLEALFLFEMSGAKMSEEGVFEQLSISSSISAPFSETGSLWGLTDLGEA